MAPDLERLARTPCPIACCASSGTRPRPSKRTQDRPFQMRVSATFLRTVDDWRRGQIDVPSRAEAIRRMVELAAKMKKKPDYDREA
jgi:hypothetical protein